VAHSLAEEEEGPSEAPKRCGGKRNDGLEPPGEVEGNSSSPLGSATLDNGSASWPKATPGHDAVGAAGLMMLASATGCEFAANMADA